MYRTFCILSQVSFSIVSINIGILGFMTFWDVRLDFISMVTIVMSIGFCVDFAAHLAYNFAKVEHFPKTPATVAKTHVKSETSSNIY